LDSIHSAFEIYLSIDRPHIFGAQWSIAKLRTYLRNL